MHKFLKPLLAVKETKRGYSIFTAAVVVIFSTCVFWDAAKAEVVIAADGDVQTIRTNTDTVGELLDDLGIDVGQYDELSHGENAKIVDGMRIHFEKANKVLVTIDGETEVYHTTAVTVGQFFQEEDLTFSRYDDISHSNIEVLRDNIEIEVNTAFPVTIKDGKEELDVWATEGTVEDLLEEEEIEYDESDKIKPALDEALEEDLKITITHIDTKTVEKEEKIPFHIEEKKDSSLAQGTTRTISDGEEGKVLKTYEITLENGEEVSREVLKEKVLQESKKKVVAVGTKAPKRAPKAAGETMTMVATAYSPNCAGCSGISATGMDLRGAPKVIAVDPNVIPLGSRVWVEGYGEAIAADTGGSIKGHKIDVLMPTAAQARNNWGRRTVQVKILH